MHDSVFVTYVIVLNIVSATLYHTHSEVCHGFESLNQIQKYSELYRKHFDTRLKVLGIVSNSFCKYHPSLAISAT